MQLKIKYINTFEIILILDPFCSTHFDIGLPKNIYYA